MQDSLHHAHITKCRRCPVPAIYPISNPTFCGPHFTLDRKCNRCMSSAGDCCKCHQRRFERCEGWQSSRCGKKKATTPLQRPRFCLEHFLEMQKDVDSWLNPLKLCVACFAPTISGTYQAYEKHPVFCCLLCAKDRVLRRLSPEPITIPPLAKIVMEYLFSPLTVGSVILDGAFFIQEVDTDTYTYKIRKTNKVQAFHPPWRCCDSISFGSLS